MSLFFSNLVFMQILPQNCWRVDRPVAVGFEPWHPSHSMVEVHCLNLSATVDVLVQQIDTVQREAIFMITCAYKGTPIHLFYTETGLEFMQDKWKQYRLIMFHKMINGLAPCHLDGLVPPSVGENTNYRTRMNTNPTLRTVPFAWSTTFLKSFTFQTVRDWNNLDANLQLGKIASFIQG